MKKIMCRLGNPEQKRTDAITRLSLIFPKAESRQLKAESLFHCGNALAQAGLIARRGVLVERPFLDGFVEHRDGGAIHLLGGGLVALFDGLAQFAQLSTQAGRVGAVARGAAYSLTGALQR